MITLGIIAAVLIIVLAPFVRHDRGPVPDDTDWTAEEKLVKRELGANHSVLREHFRRKADVAKARKGGE